jgi:phosphoribosylformimino-5-aminoimidazole carboxamide ribotide isomerase
MKVFAAVDLREGAAVQLVGGRLDQERIRLPDPVGVALRWIEAGFRAIHVVDLDAALGTGDNREVVDALARAVAGKAVLQLAGGLRDDEAVDRALRSGADRVVVGTRGIEDPAWLEALARARPGRVVLAADVRGGRIVTHGWTESTDLDAPACIGSLQRYPLAAILITDVDREGGQDGVNVGLFRQLARTTDHPVIAAGGIRSPADLQALARAGMAGAVLGMALYSGRIDPADALAQETT